ncbi:MAG: hypothetical protein HY858_02785 [Candidatus Solibacter usitatus]|nr:hypothetical protein [Candidatus Solibacter usitatus]
MDTRAKIVPAAEARLLIPAGAIVAAGHFDPLLAVHAARLAAARGQAPFLAVVVTDPPRPILPARARAELVAALRVVDLVVLDGPQAPEPALDFRAEDASASAAFIEFVHRRQN